MKAKGSLNIISQNNIMKHYRIKNIREGEDVLYLTLHPRHRSDQLNFKPGQYAAIGFTGNNGRRSPMRCFSIVSSPAHPDELQFAIRIGGKFTSSIAQLKTGKEIFVQGPFGDFLVNAHYDRNIVMLAGGIGITPIMSMIRTACQNDSSIPITLLYSYRSRHNIPFYDELQNLAKQNPKLKVIIFATNKATSPEAPHLLSGRINEHHLREVSGNNYAGSTYFLCGPIGFLQHTANILKGLGVEEDQIRTESFTQSSRIMTKSGHNIQKLTYTFATVALLIGIVGISYIDLSRYVPCYIRVTDHTQATSNNITASSNFVPADSLSSKANHQNAQQKYQSPVTCVS
jgi:ferredoxin-NADP reductase